jgi:S-formylglutathione hydrolase
MQLWSSYDASELATSYKGPRLSLLVDQGEEDSFLKEQLMPHALEQAAGSNSELSLLLRQHPGYDHSYWFIQSFIEEHVNFHASFLCPKKDVQESQ